MATQVLIGVDVAKQELVLCRWDRQQLQALPNQPGPIRAWLERLPRHCAIALEATSVYHLALMTLAHQRGHQVYLIDGYRLSNYRRSLGGRVKSDASDACLLARYLAREQHQLRPWSPPAAAYQQLQSLLHRRAALVKACTLLRQSFSYEPMLQDSLRQALQALKQLERHIMACLRKAVGDAGLQEQVQRCQAVEGIGLLTATALSMAFLRGSFRSGDAFVAFLGLDVRIKESGHHFGRRKLTKQGDPELRRLLYNAAMAMCKTAAWRPVYERYVQRGLKRTQALIILARKLARIAFALMKTGQAYRPARFSVEGWT